MEGPSPSSLCGMTPYTWRIFFQHMMCFPRISCCTHTPLAPHPSFIGPGIYWSSSPAFTAMKASGRRTKKATMSTTQTPAPKRKRGGSPSPSSSATATSSTMSGYGLSLLSSVTKSVTKRMRLGYGYALGSGTTNGDSDPSGAAASGGADTGRGGAAPAAHRAHKSPVPRREFGSPQAAGGVGVGGIGSPPFASAGPPFASASASASASGGGRKVGFTPFSDGKKTADGKLLAVSVVALVGTSCKHTHTCGRYLFTFSHLIAVHGYEQL